MGHCGSPDAMSNPQRVVSGLFKNYRPLESFGILWTCFWRYSDMDWRTEETCLHWNYSGQLRPKFVVECCWIGKGALSTTYPNVPPPAGNNLRNTLATGTTWLDIRWLNFKYYWLLLRQDPEVCPDSQWGILSIVVVVVVAVVLVVLVLVIIVIIIIIIMVNPKP